MKRFAPRRWWLLKSEPAEFSIDDLAARGHEPWTGVRNYQARNHLRAMQRGDGLFIYHSSCAEPGIVGIARVSAPASPDPTQFDPDSAYHDPRADRAAPRWWQVEVAYVRHTRRPLALSELKAHPELAGLILLRRGNRLSVMPVAAEHARVLLALETRP